MDEGGWGSVATCNEIITSNTIGIGVEEEDLKANWVADAEETGSCNATGGGFMANGLLVMCLQLDISFRRHIELFTDSACGGVQA